MGEDHAARVIQRAWRRDKARKRWNMMPRDKFIDLYVRFMQFLETLPRDYRTEDLFKVFMFYLDETRDGRWSQMKTYTVAERETYLAEQKEIFYRNQAQGVKRSSQYKTATYKF